MADEDAEPSEELEQSGCEEALEGSLSEVDSEDLDVVSSEELEEFSEEEPSDSWSPGWGELPIEELELVSDEIEDEDELYEELLSEEEPSGPKPQGIACQHPWA